MQALACARDRTRRRACSSTPASPIAPGGGVVALPEAAIASRAELLVAVGGDGTLLHAARLAGGSDVPLLGINRGRLGFLADISSAEMFGRFGDVLEGRYTRDVRYAAHGAPPRPRAAGRSATVRALNDVVLQKRETGRMMDFETWIDGHFVNTHGGDGFVVATATGSTAYALSCGGPIVTPNLDALVLAPSRRTRSRTGRSWCRASCVVEIRLVAQAPVRARRSPAMASCSATCRRTAGSSSSRPASTVTLLHPPGYDYFRILRSKLHWGRGARHGQPDA